ncbi:MAG: bifunctional phosphoribosylaminoimidazolecarboxamide formyltransferase/IMP cyclohydrolase [Planctomycetes bacterium]|nr:bifunctional phosphoribosylaminoimidazolecarboxamide formyltransferase/IMP cyclohydrolase [Planctomycetota bacterium]MCB9828892.1 bifunctional phosphoribosylaminoimidazolecarboxamide formyltransferase/IMP cyclohydrolase [Planctomycetota bacterium]MCB9902023.1 bifunctional phosphoribosylaminoimidazolecarboxamide formyltransferase/IMP cyclohydrolase [Planctomycetota bacterium]
MTDLVPLRRALLSVSDKSGLVDLGKALAARGVELVSTGGTARALREAGLAVRDVSELTGFPEMMDGRVKTLHPKVHGGLLALRDHPEHAKALEAHGIASIDLVVCNLYPFEATLRKGNVPFEGVIEEIDIGGPSMTRSAAKNHAWTAIVVEAAQYDALLAELEAHDGATSLAYRRGLAARAFARTAAYDGAIARWFSAAEGESLPASFGPMVKALDLRYGENPHQAAALYVDPLAPAGSLAAAEVLGGKALSYNNYGDVDAAWALVREFDEPACAVIKHANPCGTAVGTNPLDAYERAVACDPRSAFGGIVALNRPLTADVAKAMAVPERFLEVVIAPGIEAEAAACFTAPGAPAWGKSLRLLDAGTVGAGIDAPTVKSIDGGLLVQTADATGVDTSGWEIATSRAPSDAEHADLAFAWRVVKHVRSNAIVLAKGGQALGVGAGQMSRVEATEIAITRARRMVAENGGSLEGCVVASDAFYPFNDAIELALDAGAAAVAQPGGSRNDAKAKVLCDERGIAMVFTGKRHFRH